MNVFGKFNGWCRAALIFSLVWAVGVVGLMAYERYVTIGNTNGPWALFGDYTTLIFHHAEVDARASRFSYWLLSQRFWTALLLPVLLAWVVAGSVPALRWVRRGFRLQGL